MDRAEVCSVARTLVLPSSAIDDWLSGVRTGAGAIQPLFYVEETGFSCMIFPLCSYLPRERKPCKAVEVGNFAGHLSPRVSDPPVQGYIG